MRLGIVGSGMIGATLSELWVKAGHEVFLSSRHPEALKPLVEQLGERARAGTPAEAAAFGQVILLAVPFHVAAVRSRRGRRTRSREGLRSGDAGAQHGDERARAAAATRGAMTSSRRVKFSKDKPFIYYNELLISPAIDELVVAFAIKLLEQERLGEDDVTDYLAIGLANTLIVLTGDHGMSIFPETLTKYGINTGRISGTDVQKTATDALQAQYPKCVDCIVQKIPGSQLYLDYQKLAAAGLSRAQVLASLRVRRQTSG